MKPDAEFDAYLVRRLDEADVPDQGFTREVAARLDQHRRQRRLALAGALLTACTTAAVGVYRSPAPVFHVPDVTPEAVVATLLLAAVCSLGWIAAESA